MSEQKKCQEPECDGILDSNDFIFLQKGGFALASLRYPCNVCGRLHKWNGSTLAFSDSGLRLYKIVEGDKVIVECRDRNNNVVSSVQIGG